MVYALNNQGLIRVKKRGKRANIFTGVKAASRQTGYSNLSGNVDKEKRKLRKIALTIPNRLASDFENEKMGFLFLNVFR